MVKTIRSRLIGSYLIVVLLAMVVAAALAWRALDRAFLEVLRENLLAQARLVAQTVESGRALEEGRLVEAGAQPGIDAYSQSYNVLPGYHTRVVEAEAQTSTGVYPHSGSELPDDHAQAAEADETPRTEAYSQSANVLPGIHTRVIEGDGQLGADIYSRPVNVLPGHNPQVVEVVEQPITGAYSQTADVMPGYNRQVVEVDEQSSADVYSQTLNVVPGYHTRVVDEDGTVILDLAEIDASGSAAVQDWSQFDEVGELATKLDLDTTGKELVEPLRGREEIQRAMAGEPATAVRAYSWAPDRRVLYAAHPVRSADGSVSSVVYIASPLPRLSLSLLPTYFGPQVLGGVILAVLLAGAAGVMLARTLSRPLERLTGAAEALSRGEQAPPIPAAPTAELSRLTAAFNRMNANLSSARGQLIARAEEREIILDGLSDGVIAASSTGEIVLTNPAGTDLLDFAPKHIRQAIDQTLASGEKQTTEFAARDRIIELVVSPLKGDENRVSGAVAVGHDVTAHRQLDRLRRRFVSDVSHELRTPLTAIKGFVETLRDGAAEDPATRDRFLRTIDGETDRLIRLASELLLLARADAGRLDLVLEPADLELVAQRAIAQLAGRASAKDLTITVTHARRPVFAHADADRIQQVLINLLDNAVKFTPSGGSVSVSMRGSGHEALCTVSDTGPGIPTDEVPHLFQRFYRGDRSRSRAEGESGSGLGLSIAMAIVEAHGGRIWVESDPPVGTVVSFTLPLAG